MPEPSQKKTERVDDIIALYIALCEAGNPPDEQEIITRNPEYESDLRAFFEDRRHLMVLLQSEDPPRLGEDYEILQLIDDGGQGVVYKAHQKSLNKIVAIKIPKQSSLQSDPEGIRKEAQRAARLRHPNIVTVHHVGEHEGQRFFVMDFIEGQSLARLIAKGPLAPFEAVRYVKTIAQAIHYAHQREILHCDLKPGNILLDEEGTPYVTDFGLAKRLGEGGRYQPYDALGGTASYMAPEQARRDELTTATDVYGIGAILYSLLTGSPPFHGSTPHETMQLVQKAEPLRPRQRNATVDADLEAICLKCLQKDPEKRYGSADVLVLDLEKYQGREETTARSWTRRERAGGWYRRKPVLSGSVTAAAIISILTVVILISIAQAQQQARMREGLASNTAIAKALAKPALLHLRDWGRIVELAAANSGLPQMLAKKDLHGLQHYVEGVCKESRDVCESSGIRDDHGISLARVPKETPTENAMEGLEAANRNSSRRDYFLGGLAHSQFSGLQSVHISSVYTSTVDKKDKFAFSAPILDRAGRALGIILMSVTTDAALGLVKFDDPNRRVVLIAPRDPFVPDSGRVRAGSVLLFHPALGHGDPAIDFSSGRLTSASLEPIHDTELKDSDRNIPPDDNYQDPAGISFPDYRGRWIAGFAPVGNTGFFIAVQQRADDVLNVNAFSWNVTAGFALALAVFGVVIVILSHRAERG